MSSIKNFVFFKPVTAKLKRHSADTVQVKSLRESPVPSGWHQPLGRAQQSTTALTLKCAWVSVAFSLRKWHLQCV